MQAQRPALSVGAGRRRRRRPRLGRAALIAVGATAGGAALAGCTDATPNTLNPAGSKAETVATLWWVLFAVSMVVIVGVTAVLLWAVATRRGPDTRIRPGSGGRLVLVAGIVVPAVVLTATYAVGLTAMRSMRAPAEAASDIRVDVVGHLWWWEVRYPGRDVVTANEIHVPVGSTVRLRLTTADVNHSLWVPQLAPKTDLVAGRTNTMWLRATETGVYRGRCAEYCGMSHGHMGFSVVAQSPDDFESWVRDRRRPAAAEPDSEAAARGREIFLAGSCASCHTIAGTAADGEIGPDLTHLASRAWLGAETVPNDPEQLAAWITDPRQFKPGARMPPQPLSAPDLAALVAYLETLQ